MRTTYIVVSTRKRAAPEGRPLRRTQSVFALLVLLTKLTVCFATIPSLPYFAPWDLSLAS